MGSRGRSGRWRVLQPGSREHPCGRGGALEVGGGRNKAAMYWSMEAGSNAEVAALEACLAKTRALKLGMM
jgi:hypothetical protein